MDQGRHNEREGQRTIACGSTIFGIAIGGTLPYLDPLVLRESSKQLYMSYQLDNGTESVEFSSIVAK